MQEDKVDYFIEQTNQRLDRMDRKLDRLLHFRGQLLGGAVGISSLISIFIGILGLIISKWGN